MLANHSCWPLLLLFRGKHEKMILLWEGVGSGKGVLVDGSVSWIIVVVGKSFKVCWELIPFRSARVSSLNLSFLKVQQSCKNKTRHHIHQSNILSFDWLSSAALIWDKFSKSAHKSAHGTPPQPLQSQNNAHMNSSIIFSVPEDESIHANHHFSCMPNKILPTPTFGA